MNTLDKNQTQYIHKPRNAGEEQPLPNLMNSKTRAHS